MWSPGIGDVLQKLKLLSVSKIAWGSSLGGDLQANHLATLSVSGVKLHSKFNHSLIYQAQPKSLGEDGPQL